MDKILACKDLKALFIELSEDEASAKAALMEVEKKYPDAVKKDNVNDIIAIARAKKQNNREER